MLKGKKIVLGITGSIAAYKACLIIRGLVKAGAEVQVVITPAGKEFITPITLSALTQKPVISDFFSQRDGTWHSHVALGLWADAMLIAPCTASTLGKMANGIADNMLISDGRGTAEDMLYELRDALDTLIDRWDLCLSTYEDIYRKKKYRRQVKALAEEGVTYLNKIRKEPDHENG